MVDEQPVDVYGGILVVFGKVVVSYGVIVAIIGRHIQTRFL